MNELSFPMSWYPLCRSADLKRGRVLQRDAFGIALAVFRTQAGRVGAVHARCVHMGANLAHGTVTAERSRCPLHHWEYSTCGRCERIPGSASVPSRARQLALTCEEHYGLVFAFLGPKPLFAFPHFESGDPSLHSQAHSMDFDTPYQVFAANSFDGQHFATVHNRVLLEPPSLTSITAYHFGTRFRARVGGNSLNDRLIRALGIQTVELRADCWGGNMVLAHSSRTANNILFAILPVNACRSVIFIVNALPLASVRARLVWQAALEVTHQLMLMFLKPDVAVMRGLQFQPGVLLPELDHSFIEWTKYWKALPRITALSCGQEGSEAPSA